MDIDEKLKHLKARQQKAQAELSRLREAEIDLSLPLNRLVTQQEVNQALIKALERELKACQDIEEKAVEALEQLRQDNRETKFAHRKDALRKKRERTLKELSETTEPAAQAEMLLKLAKVKSEINNLQP
ncbi:MAG: hypothetical protein CVU88_01085 [Firmicutes bacterium HGW-Firmicutes-13]|nr:MAG: hypothetical protein CVU88_01085 [Firmicutes bacterium HGW-Firmicutes-13]